MQTKINKSMAMGVPGTHGNGQPYFADTYIVAAGETINMGYAVAMNEDGTVRNPESSDEIIGIAVNPREHVNMALPSDTSTLSVSGGATVAVAKKGSWYVKTAPADVGAGGALTNEWSKGQKLVFSSTPDYSFAPATGGFSPVAEVLEVEYNDEAENYEGSNVKFGIALIRFM